MKKLKKKIKKLILVCFVCFAISPALSAYDELIEKKYKTFDTKIFETKENAILHEKVQKNVEVLMGEFKKDMEEFEQKKAKNIKDRIGYNRIGYTGMEYVYLDELREKKNLYEEYENCLYRCIKSLEEKGIEVEIKINAKSLNRNIINERK